MISRFEFKYRIKERFDLLNHEEYKIAMKAIPKALKISQRTFYRYMYTRIHEKYSMPVDHLARIARYFDCKIDNMLNYEPKPLKIGVKDRNENIDIATKFKLVK